MRIGTLGAARITPKALLEPALELEGIEVVAVAARDERKAALFAETHGIPIVHESYEALVEDESLDAVYNPLPASEHGPWSTRALEAGRHVLVEKPFAMNETEARAMVEVARWNGRVLLEAFHWRYHPLATRMIEVAGMLGPLRRGEAVFEARIADLEDIRYDPLLGGGSTMDLGCYPVHWLRTLAGEEPKVTRATAGERPAGIDVSLEAGLLFPSGLEAVVRSSMAAETERPEAYVVLEGARGTMRVENPLAPQRGHRLTAELDDGTRLDEALDLRSTYSFQLEAFARVVAGEDEPLTGYDDAIGNMATIDAMYRAAGLSIR